MRKPAVILLLLVLFYVQAGYLVSFTIEREIAREEFKELQLASLPDSAFKVFALDEIATKLEWEEEGKEFWYNGDLYDVGKIAINNGKKFIYCINDKKEESIVEAKNNITKSNTQTNSKEGKRIKFYNPELFYPTPEEVLFNYWINKDYSILQTRKLIHFISSVSPPPEC